MIAGFQHKGGPAAVWQIAGTALYLVSVLILVGYHVPRNDQLMKADPAPPGQVPPGRTSTRHGWLGITPAHWPPPAASSPCEHAKHRSSGHGHAPTRRWSGTSCPAAGHHALELASQPDSDAEHSRRRPRVLSTITSALDHRQNRPGHSCYGVSITLRQIAGRGRRARSSVMDGDRVAACSFRVSAERDDLCVAMFTASPVVAGRFGRRLPALLAARRRTSQTVAAMRRDRASSQPPSIRWNGQNGCRAGRPSVAYSRAGDGHSGDVPADEHAGRGADRERRRSRSWRRRLRWRLRGLGRGGPVVSARAGRRNFALSPGPEPIPGRRAGGSCWPT